MGLWGSTTSKDNRPKFLPEDDNASGSTEVDNTPSQLVVGGHFPLPLALSGNDNKDGHPEVLVCIRNLALLVLLQ